jgi:hypothetical protein
VQQQQQALSQPLQTIMMPRHQRPPSSAITIQAPPSTAPSSSATSAAFRAAQAKQRAELLAHAKGFLNPEKSKEKANHEVKPDGNLSDSKPDSIEKVEEGK